MPPAFLGWRPQHRLCPTRRARLHLTFRLPTGPRHSCVTTPSPRTPEHTLMPRSARSCLMSVCHLAPNWRPTPPPRASGFRPLWPPIFAHKTQSDCRPSVADTDERRNALYGESSGESSRMRGRTGMMVASKRPQRGGGGGGARTHRGRGTSRQRGALLPVGHRPAHALGRTVRGGGRVACGGIANRLRDCACGPTARL